MWESVSFCELGRALRRDGLKGRCKPRRIDALASLLAFCFLFMKNTGRLDGEVWGRGSVVASVKGERAGETAARLA